MGYCKQHRTTDFRIRLIRDERETYLIALVCDLSNINMEKKQNKFTDFHFFIRCYGKQKRLKIIEKK